MAPTDVIIPSSDNIVTVKILRSFDNFSSPIKPFFTGAPGVDAGSPTWSACGYTFLIEHAPSGTKTLFDLGIRKHGLETATPALANRLKQGGFHVEVEEDVSDQLVAASIQLEDIEAVIWSHSHFDHVGDMTTFPKTTALVVGPGTQEHIRPGYPVNPEGVVFEEEFEGREVREIDFPQDGPTIGGFLAHDYFGDGSFYLLDTPGHCIGHIAGLARTTITPTPTFIFMGGDIAHHPALLRPSIHSQLPAALDSRLPESLRTSSSKSPYLVPPEPGVGVNHDRDQAVRTIEKVQSFDAHPDIFVIMAHDASLQDIVDMLPREANRWREKRWKDRAFWAFLDKGNVFNRWEKDVKAA